MQRKYQRLHQHQEIIYEISKKAVIFSPRMSSLGVIDLNEEAFVMQFSLPALSFIAVPSPTLLSFSAISSYSTKLHHTLLLR